MGKIRSGRSRGQKVGFFILIALSIVICAYGLHTVFVERIEYHGKLISGSFFYMTGSEAIIVGTSIFSFGLYLLVLGVKEMRSKQK
jgi:hypothetical protein